MAAQTPSGRLQAAQPNAARTALSKQTATRASQTLPGTEPIRRKGDLALQMQQDVDQLLLRWIDQADENRVDSRATVEKSREHFARLIGLVDPRTPQPRLELVAEAGTATEPTTGNAIRVTPVRWQVLEGVTAAGYLLEPAVPPKALVVALADADSSPESICGLVKPNREHHHPFALDLAAEGCRVLVPTLIDRKSDWSGRAAIRKLNQPHREFVYRPAFYLGRHIIGYEVQKVLSAVDYFTNGNGEQQVELPIGVVGHAEGGLIAFYAAAVDTRIDAAWVSGYFQNRSGIWREPIYRNVWGLLSNFGDARIAELIAPRGLLIEASRGVEVSGPPPPAAGARSYAATGSLTSPPVASVRAEFAHAQTNYKRRQTASQCRLIESANGLGPAGSERARKAFLELLTVDPLPVADATPTLHRVAPQVDPRQRMRRQFEELVAYNQKLFWQAAHRRTAFWEGADSSTVESWLRSKDRYRRHLLTHIIGDRVVDGVPLGASRAGGPPPLARTRLIYETPKWNGYEVTLDVDRDLKLWAYGILLVPHQISGNKLPVVVAQHGRGGRPQQICDPQQDHRAYHRFGARLADRGYVVFAPQHLYFGEERYRLLQRKANPLGLSFFAPMVWQHRAILRWLQTLDFVAAERIGFYGISYGGKSALLIPAVLPEYALSICSGAFTDTVRKHIDAVGGNQSVFLFTNEYEHLEFDFAEKFNHAEIAWLISPRPFMVEKGHGDGGLPDEWTAYAYARVRRHYVQLQIPDRTRLEFFPGGHEINAAGTFEFLNRFLKPVAPVPD